MHEQTNFIPVISYFFFLFFSLENVAPQANIRAFREVLSEGPAESPSPTSMLFRGEFLLSFIVHLKERVNYHRSENFLLLSGKAEKPLHLARDYSSRGHQNHPLFVILSLLLSSLDYYYYFGSLISLCHSTPNYAIENETVPWAW